MKRGIALAVLATLVVLAGSPVRAANFRVGPSVGVRGSATPIGVGLGFQLQDKWWFDFDYSYMNFQGNDISVINPNLVYRTGLNDQWEWFVGGGLAVMPTHIGAHGWNPAKDTTPIGFGVNGGSSYKLTDKILLTPYLEYAYAQNDFVRISYTGLGLRLDFELGK